MKKNNYNINFNAEPLQTDQINQHKDFEALLKMHAQQAPPEAQAPVARRRWMYRSIAAGAAACIGLLAYFTFFAANQPTPAQVQAAHFAAQPYVNPPIKGVEARFASKSINASKGGVYNYDTGSRVIVPPAAFVDQDGQVVEGEVNIRYREFHDFVDFFLSGIPMEYDSAGLQYNLESAGMIEIYAEQDGKRLNMSPNKKIDVELVSEIKLKDKDAPLNFNIYRLDTEKRNWVYTGVDRIERIEEDDKASELLTEEASIEQNFQQQIDALAQEERAAFEKVEASVPQPAAPVRPKRQNPDAYSFDLKFNNSSIDYNGLVPSESQQEIDENLAAMDDLRKQYKNTMWEVAPNNENFNENAVKSIAWEDMKLRQINNRDYELTLINGNNSMKLFVNPVLTGDDYEAAMAAFNEEFNAYETKMAERRALLESQKEEISQRIAEERAMAQEKYEKRMADYRARGEDNRATDLMIKQKIVNRFQVTNFGVWNCDRPLPPYIYTLKGEFRDKTASDLHQNVAFLVDKTQNTVVRFYATKGADVRFNQNSDKMMWIVTNDNKIALYKKEEFKKINKKRGNHTFVMDLMDKEIKTEEDVRKILLF